ncbi:MAG: hypothetical protein ACRDQD_30995, partial [Nocardioidaceae bacterium]
MAPKQTMNPKPADTGHSDIEDIEPRDTEPRDTEPNPFTAGGTSGIQILTAGVPVDQAPWNLQRGSAMPVHRYWPFA